MSNKRVGNQYSVNIAEEVSLSNPIFGERWFDEIKEIDKHEIIIKICDLMGSCPSNLHIAENIFETVKLEMTRFVIHHEYCRCNRVRSKLLIWLDSRINPARVEKLSEFMNKYLK